MERHKDPCPLDIQYTWRSRPLSVSPYPPPSPFAAADQSSPYDLTCRSLPSLTSRATQSLSTSSPLHWSRRVLVVSGDGAHGIITVCSLPRTTLTSSLSPPTHSSSLSPPPHSCLTIVPLYLVVFLPRRTFGSSGTCFSPLAACPLLLAAWLCSRQKQTQTLYCVSTALDVAIDSASPEDDELSLRGHPPNPHWAFFERPRPRIANNNETDN